MIKFITWLFAAAIILAPSTVDAQSFFGGGGGGGGTPGGSNTQCQYNNSGAFGGVSGCTSDGTNISVTTQSTSDNSTKAASTAYVTTAVANALAGVNPAVAVQAATTAASDTSGLTYNNGASGIGAFFTGSVNTAITIDGYTFTAVGQRLLVKNDTQSPSGAFNGVYYVTQVQTGILPPILTRALDYDTPSDINNTGAIPVINGTVNGTTQWVITSSVATVGTSPLTYAKFSSAPASLANLSGGNVFTGQQTDSVTTLAISTATFTPDGSNNNYKITLVHASCPCTIANPSATPVAGTSGVIEIDQSATGSDTVGTWGSQYYTQGGVATLTLSTAASAKDFVSYYVADSTHIIVQLSVTNAAH